MSEPQEPNDLALAFEYELDAPPAKVWRALTVPELVERWLPTASHRPSMAPAVSLRLIEADDGKFIRYGWHETDAPLGDSVVTFELAPNAAGGTTFRILHQLAAARPQAANCNVPDAGLVMRLAA